MSESLWTLDKVLKHLADNNEKLFIPSYQRGYRWTPVEIRQLMDDIAEQQPGGHYFLQLLAVREDRENSTLRIIDGQQRLTTALLVLDYLDGSSLIRDNMVYETRTESPLDKHFMDGASETISSWFSDKSAEIIQEFSKALLGCEFLFFPVKDADAESDFFSRLNTWKIVATDAELAKCFFLSNDDLAEIEKRAIRWNQMERRLSDNGFWGMFSDHGNATDDRMEVLLSYALDARQAGERMTKERFRLFELCRKAEKTGTTRGELWSRVERVFGLLSKWHGDRACRHLVGWFFHCSVKTISEARSVVAVDEHTVANAIKTARYLLGDGKWLEDPNLYETMCGESRKWLLDYLLLANVAWCSEQSGVDYDFHRHNLVDCWSVEHVHARNQRMLDKIEFKGLKFKNGEDPETLWKEYRETDGRDEANAFLQDKLSAEAGYPEENEDHSLGNLALLPKDANSCLNDKLFGGKRREILSWALQKEDSCYWAPPLTVAMFVKEIGDPVDKFLPYWSLKDRAAYADMVKSLVGLFLGRWENGANGTGATEA